MASFKKILAVGFVSVALIVVPARRADAIVPVILGWLSATTMAGSNLLVADVFVGSIGAIATYAWWECNKFTWIAPCTSTAPFKPDANLPKPALTVSLKPDQKRENPDPAKFNDPVPGKRDVTPKPKIAASGNPPPPAPAGPAGVGQYEQTGSETGPTSDDTFQQQYTLSNNYGGVMVAGVVLVKQMFAPTRGFPYVAMAVNCNVPLTGDQQPALDACASKNNQAAAAVLAYGGANRSYLSRGGMGPQTAGVLRYVHVVTFYDYAQDVTVSCDAGYQLNQADFSQCDLVNAAAVKKPKDTTCEVLFDPASKKMLTDPANPACDGLSDTTKFSIFSPDGKQGVEISANAGNGFDVTITKSDGSKTTFDTGVYDPATGNYVIVHVTNTPPPNPENGMGCGGPGQGSCSVEFALDSATSKADADTRTADKDADTRLKGVLDGVSSANFGWSFIPNIPTAECTNPKLRSPLGDSYVEMDICGGFNQFSFFLKAVLAVICLYGCVRQVERAIKA
jgi:hypothetical protein